MTPDNYPKETQLLRDICHRFGERGWCRATSGNFSLRIENFYCLITRSGKEKSRLTPDDLMICDLGGHAVDAACRPSAETPLHTRLYQLDDSIGAVLHTHSIPATLVSRRSGSQVKISGFEMQKALVSVDSHEAEIRIPIYDNDQDMHALAHVVEKAWRENPFTVPGFLIRGHGLYAWGRTGAEAQRHVEGLEFLFACLWQESLAQS